MLGGRRNVLVAILLDHDLVGWQWAGVGLGVHASDDVVEHFLSDPGVHYVCTKLWLLKECKSGKGVHGVARGAECQLDDQIMIAAEEREYSDVRSLAYSGLRQYSR